MEEQTQFDKDEALRLVPPKHQQKLDMLDTSVCILDIGALAMENNNWNFDLNGIAGCLRTPEGGSSKQYLVVKKDGTVHARLLTVRRNGTSYGSTR